jgi:hypothetical protein
VFLAKLIIQYTATNWQISSVTNLSGSRYSQSGTAAGYLSTVSTDATLSGDGTAGNPLTVANLYLKLDGSNDPLTGQLEIQTATDDESLVIRKAQTDTTHAIDIYHAPNPNPVAYIDVNGNCSFPNLTGTNTGDASIQNLDGTIAVITSGQNFTISVDKTGIKLDDLAAPDDNTDLDASASKHGLMPKNDKVKLDLLTLATAASITGGGTLALGGYNLTVPTNGTAALLGSANTFTALNSFERASGAWGLNVAGTLDSASGIGIRVASTFSGDVSYGGYIGGTHSGTSMMSGLSVIPTFATSTTSGAIHYGLEVRPQMSATSGTQATTYGIISVPVAPATSNHTMTSVTAGYFRVDNASTAGATIASAYGVRIGTPTATGTITTKYGLYIDTQADYAIYTNGGQVRLGGDLFHTGSNVGFFNVGPAARPSAYTQNYTTASKTVANPTSATLTDNTGGAADTTLAAVEATYTQATIRNNFADLAAMVNKLTADVLADKKVITQIIDDLQSLGILQ